VNSCYFTMVAVDADRKPVQVPELTPQTPEQQQRWDQAFLRKQARQMVHGAKSSGPA
jgi:acyl-CoA hydrolase